MKGGFAKREDRLQPPNLYLLARNWWVLKMERITAGRPRAGLLSGLVLFCDAGALICIHNAARGFRRGSAPPVEFGRVAAMREAEYAKAAEPFVRKMNIARFWGSSLEKQIDSIIFGKETDTIPKIFNYGKTGLPDWREGEDSTTTNFKN